MTSDPLSITCLFLGVIFNRPTPLSIFSPTGVWPSFFLWSHYQFISFFH